MKLRAPRCRDSVLLMSVPDSSKRISPSSASAVPAPRSPTMINTLALIMSRNPFRLRLHAVEFRVPGHQQEERKVQSGADSRQDRVDARGRLHAAYRQGDERYGKDRQHHFVNGPLVAYRAHRGA